MGCFPKRAVIPGLVRPTTGLVFDKIRDYGADLKAYSHNIRAWRSNIKSYSNNIKSYSRNIKSYWCNLRSYDDSIGKRDGGSKWNGIIRRYL